MIYYNLHSEYQGDETKGCSLTIDEVDNNFYELERNYHTLKTYVDEVTEDMRTQIEYLQTEMNKISYTVHDSIICKPGTSLMANYTILDEFGYDMLISGVISYYGELLPNGEYKGNRFGIAIIPKYDKQKIMYPDAFWCINDTYMGNLWEEIESNPSDWETALYFYPKVQRDNGNVMVSLAGITNNTNTLTITINWDVNHCETYSYVVDRDVILEEFLSATMHDAVICPPGVSDSASYVLSEDGYTMEIGGEISHDSIHGGNRFGVAIQPLYETTQEKYPNATWYINDTEVGSLWTTIDESSQGCVKALYLQPKVDKTPSGNLVVSLFDLTNCDNTINIRIDWDDNKSETYTYIVKEDVILSN